MKRTCTIGILALILAVTAMHTPAGSKLLASAKSFNSQFQALKGAASISPIERLVFSLAMTSYGASSRLPH
jgi:hypothetical protein